MSHLQIVAVLPWELQKAIFQLYSTATLIKQLIFQSLP